MGILTDDMRRVVDAELGFVATVCPDGTPNLSPKGTIAVWDDDHLVFADLRSPGTIENLRSNPSIEVNVVDQLSRAGYRLKGTVRARERIHGIVIVAIRRVEPVTSPAYDLGASEAELRALHLRRLLGQPDQAVDGGTRE
jgi:predicted pyridoxine 5'-phosphate oxidase superfamily flavin-nucleotide-binding protein